MNDRHTYTLGWLGTPLRLFVVGWLGLFGIALLAGAIVYGHEGSSEAFDAWALACPAVWLTIWLWLAYHFLWRYATSVSFDSTHLSWSTPLRTRSARLESVRRVRPHHPIVPAILVIEVDGAPSVQLQLRKGLGPWLGALTSALPGLEVQGGEWVRRVEGLPDWFATPGGYRREDGPASHRS